MKTNLKLALFLAAKTLKRGDKGSLILTTLIMLIVFLNLLFVDAIFEGISVTMDEGKIDFQYGEIIIEPKDGEQYIRRTEEIIDKVKDFYFIKSLAPHLRAAATLRFDKQGDGRDVADFEAGVIGIDPAVENQVIDLKSHLIAGRFLEKNDFGQALLGADAAGGYGSSVFPSDLEGVRVGDKITAEYKNGLVREYKIIGIFKTKNFDTDSKLIVTADDLNTVLGTTKEASEIIIRLTKRSYTLPAVQILKRIGLSDYQIFTWYEKLAFGRKINRSFEMIGFMLRVIGSLVAGLVIFIVIFVDIVNRRRQIGILKAIGIPEQAIKYSYVFQGIFHAFWGVVFGFLVMKLGIITYFRYHPIDFPMGDMVPVIKRSALKVSVILFLIAGLIGSIIPASREVHKKILELMK